MRHADQPEGLDRSLSRFRKKVNHVDRAVLHGKGTKTGEVLVVDVEGRLAAQI